MSQPHDGSPESSSNTILIPPGAFIMGTDIEPFYGTVVEQSKHAKMDESPIHVVYLAPYYVDCQLVTNAEYEAFTRATDYPTPTQWKRGKFLPGEAKLPVVNVNWHGARAYAQWAGKRLPMEAEWEKAARGVDGRVYPWGDEFEPSGSVESNEGIEKQKNGRTTAQVLTDRPTPVGNRPNASSPYGIHDVAGNVWEWIEDWYQPYDGNRQRACDYGKKHKVLRGGSWLEVRDQTAARYFRCANRLHAPQNYTANNIGFRCVRDATPEDAQRHAPQVSLELLTKFVRQQKLKNLHIVQRRARRHSIQDFLIAAALIGGGWYGMVFSEFAVVGFTGSLIGIGFLFSASVNIWRQWKAARGLKQYKKSEQRG